jgi:hypothetical protein
MRIKKSKGVILKLEFEKAYDKVNWGFMMEVLRKKHFPEKWIEWMHQIVGGRVGINLNGVPGNFFRTFKGLRQVDPLSPLPFNLVSVALATMLDKAKEADEIRGLALNLVEGGLTHLQYADDTILFSDLDEQSIINVKFLVYCFECMSGLRINFQKNEVFVLGASDAERESC